MFSLPENNRRSQSEVRTAGAEIYPGVTTPCPCSASDMAGIVDDCIVCVAAVSVWRGTDARLDAVDH
jgi:hypothetical protein